MTLWYHPCDTASPKTQLSLSTCYTGLSINKYNSVSGGTATPGHPESHTCCVSPSTRFCNTVNVLTRQKSKTWERPEGFISGLMTTQIMGCTSPLFLCKLLNSLFIKLAKNNNNKRIFFSSLPSPCYLISKCWHSSLTLIKWREGSMGRAQAMIAGETPAPHSTLTKPQVKLWIARSL